MTIEITLKKTNDHPDKAFARTVDRNADQEPVYGEPVELTHDQDVSIVIWDTRTIEVYEEKEPQS